MDSKICLFLDETISNVHEKSLDETDGGFWGWSTVAGACLMQVTSMGIQSSW